jgi:uncharacterized protein
LLFGAGVVLFTARAGGPDGPIRIADLYYRRTLWLALFGLVRAYVLLNPGDILFVYGFAGLFLFPLRLLTPARLIVLAGILLAFPTALSVVSSVSAAALEEQVRDLQTQEAAGRPLSGDEEASVNAWRQRRDRLWPPESRIAPEVSDRVGPVTTLYASNARRFPVGQVSFMGMLQYTAVNLMLMLLGMALLKWRVLAGERSAFFHLRLMAVGYGIGLPLRAGEVWSSWATTFDASVVVWQPFGELARIAVTLGHLGLFLLLWNAARQSRAMRALAAVGRMAFTNYVGQTVIGNAIFSGVGFGMYGALDRAEVYAIMLVIWAAQLAFSVWWMSRFQFGPIEWAWRSLTYWRPQPMRQPSPPSAVLA